MVLVILGNGEKVDLLGYKNKVSSLDGCDAADSVPGLSAFSGR